MEIEDLVDEILEKLYSDPQHPDKYTNMRIVRADIWSMVETYTDELDAGRIEELEEELAEAESQIKTLEEQLAEANE